MKTLEMEILVATSKGCRIYSDSGKHALELDGQSVGPLAVDAVRSSLAVVGGTEIRRRGPGGGWSTVATSPSAVLPLTAFDGRIIAGTMADAHLLQTTDDGRLEPIPGFDLTEGRDGWFASGPPLHVRALTVTADQSTILAAVHVGGIARSVDGGRTWHPTVPIEHDIHEVRAHPSRAAFVAAASARGLCLSDDGGARFRVLSEGLELTDSLAVAVLEDEVLFSIQEGPFASRSQIWRWRQGDDRLEQVLSGLPRWLDGKVDTDHLVARGGRAAVIDGGGNLYVSRSASSDWVRIATGIEGASGVQML